MSKLARGRPDGRLRTRPRGAGFWFWPARPVARQLLQRKLARCGRGATFDPITSTFAGLENISLGDNVFIGPRSFISVTHARLTIGDDTVIGPEFCAMSGDHKFDEPGRLHHEPSTLGENEPIEVGCNVWIGARVTVLKGVRIGDGAIIGAGSVVTHDVPSQTVVAGCPARVRRPRFEGADRDRHERRLAPMWGHVYVNDHPQ